MLYTVFSAICVKIFFAAKKEEPDDPPQREPSTTSACSRRTKCEVDELDMDHLACNNNNNNNNNLRIAYPHTP